MTAQIVLTFHGVGAPPADEPPKAAPFWIPTQRFVDIADAIAAARREGCPVQITFDDGFASDAAIAAPILAERGLSAQFFVLAGRIGAPHALDRDGIGLLAALGMRIGSHGADHVDWRRLDAAARRREFQWARTEIQAVTGRLVADVAVPFGAYNSQVIRQLRLEGYRRAYTSDGGTADDTAFVQPRTTIRAETGDAALRDILADRVPIHRRLRRTLATTLRHHV